MEKKPVLIAGNNSLTCSIVACLLNAGIQVYLYTQQPAESISCVEGHLADMEQENFRSDQICPAWVASESIHDVESCRMAILVTDEQVESKRTIIRQVEDIQSKDMVIAVNTESIGLDEIQLNARHPERIIGLNWSEPAHTTKFLEIITNSSVRKGLAEEIRDISLTWNKDAYIVNNVGLRSRLLSAMIREAFYLVENGYATVDDIDRACRNDAGYYLPFAGNCRYMDLMGTYAYGMVMKDLNPDLSKDRHLPDFFNVILNDGGLGMQNGNGFYQYTPEEVSSWKKVHNEFSYQIGRIIKKYPFNYQQKG